MVAADGHPEQHLRPVDVREAGAVVDRPAALQQLECGLDLAALHPCPGLRGECASLELDRPGGQDCGAGVLELVDRLVVPMGVRERFCPCEHPLDAAPLVGGDPALEETGVGAELGGEPLDRLARGTGLAPLDLADVLLGEALAGQVGLGESGRYTQLPHALAQAGAARGGRASAVAEGYTRHEDVLRSETHT